MPTRVDKAGPAAETESLKDEARNIHEEARMVLPGIQALFGFQLIASFNQRFGDLDALDATIYFISLLIVALVTGMIMTPAAYDARKLPATIRDQIEQFFISATALTDKKVKIKGWANSRRALQFLQSCLR